MTGRLCLWRPNSARWWRINGNITVGIGLVVVIRIGPESWVWDNHYSMMFPTAKWTVAEMAAGYRPAAMLEGECAGDCLTRNEDQN
jgi:hypothetical protein